MGDFILRFALSSQPFFGKRIPLMLEPVPSHLNHSVTLIWVPTCFVLMKSFLFEGEPSCSQDGLWHTARVLVLLSLHSHESHKQVLTFVFIPKPRAGRSFCNSSWPQWSTLKQPQWEEVHKTFGMQQLMLDKEFLWTHHNRTGRSSGFKETKPSQKIIDYFYNPLIHKVQP